MSYIEINNVCKEYKSGDNTIKALDNISFSIDKGEFVIILGSSGAGKTTLLNILGGMDNLTSGNYIIDDKDIGKASYKELESFRRNDIGFVFQFYNLMNNLSAYENVNIAASIVNNPLSTSKLLENVGLTKRMKNFPSQLSGGEQQRVAIARAIAKNPKLLLCDEPTGALDSKTGVEVLKLLKKQCDKNDGANTVIIVTHNALFADIADTVIRVKNGQIESVTKNENPKNIDEVKW